MSKRKSIKTKGIVAQMEESIKRQANYNILDRQGMIDFFDSIEEPKKTAFTALVKCKTRGSIMIDASSFETCNDDKCGVCSSWNKAMNDLIKNNK